MEAQILLVPFPLHVTLCCPPALLPSSQGGRAPPSKTASFTSAFKPPPTHPSSRTTPFKPSLLPYPQPSWKVPISPNLGYPQTPTPQILLRKNWSSLSAVSSWMDPLPLNKFNPPNSG